MDFPEYSKIYLPEPILSSARSPLKIGLVALTGILCSAFFKGLTKA